MDLFPALSDVTRLIVLIQRFRRSGAPMGTPKERAQVTFSDVLTLRVVARLPLGRPTCVCVCVCRGSLFFKDSREASFFTLSHAHGGT